MDGLEENLCSGYTQYFPISTVATGIRPLPHIKDVNTANIVFGGPPPSSNYSLCNQICLIRSIEQSWDWQQETYRSEFLFDKGVKPLEYFSTSQTLKTK